MHPDAEWKLLKGRVPELSDGDCKNFIKYALLTRAAYNQGEVQQGMSPRTLINWGKKSVAYGSVRKAYEVSFGNGLSEDCRKICKENFNKVFGD